MSSFQGISDAPFKLDKEALEISIKIEKTGPTTARISWNIPPSIAGCSSDKRAYNGIVITLDTTSTDLSKIPVDGNVYTSDPTANILLHAGDKIGTSLVVGAFYNDIVTTFVDVDNILANEAYYVSGYAVDNVNRYHKSGVHSYSLPYGKKDEVDNGAYQIVSLNNGSGVAPLDLTGLSLLTNYTFKLILENDREELITINGSNAQTYQDLIDELNKQFSLLDSPFQGVNPPNTGTYYWNSTESKLYIWDGFQHNLITNVIIDDQQPNTPLIGEYWYKSNTEELFKWDGLVWVLQTQICYHKDPTQVDCDDYWFNGSTLHIWNGDVWIPFVTYVQTTDPSIAPNVPCGTYWFDENVDILKYWDEDCSSWKAVNAFYLDHDPTMPFAGEYWFDSKNQKLYKRVGTVWVLQNAVISPTQPTTGLIYGLLWFNTSTNELKIYDVSDVNAWTNIKQAVGNLNSGPQLVTLSYSFMQAGVATDNGLTSTLQDPNVVHLDFINEISLAFNEWKTLIEDTFNTDNGFLNNLTINFVNLGDETGISTPSIPSMASYAIPGTENLGDIRIGMHNIDGVGEQLTHSYQFTSGVPGTLANESGDIHFDSSDDWRLDGYLESGHSIKLLMAREIGHVLGLEYNSDNLSVMFKNPLNSDEFAIKFPSGLKDSLIDKNELKEKYTPGFQDLNVIVWNHDPTQPVAGELWWNSFNDQLFVWDSISNSWNLVNNFVISSIDPSLPPIFDEYTAWFSPSDNIMKVWDGSKWVEITFINHLTTPNTPVLNDVWCDTQNNLFYTWNGLSWVLIDPIFSNTDPYIPTIGDFWFNTLLNTLNQWNGTSWVNIVYSSTPLTPLVDSLWFNTATEELNSWNGVTWSIIEPLVLSSFTDDGNLIFVRTDKGSFFSISLSQEGVTNPLFNSLLTPGISLVNPVVGGDGVSGTPSYTNLGVGTDGSVDERRKLIEDIRLLLGAPTIRVELTNAQLDKAVDNALAELRKRGSVSLKRGFIFLQLEAGVQSYKLSNKKADMHKIVDILDIMRTNSSFMGTLFGNDVFGQAAVQTLYGFTGFDLISYHLVAQYVETLEHLFAGDINYQWDEHTRRLNIFKRIMKTEVVLLDVMVEKTEQELLVDRFTGKWLQQWALAEAKLMLAQIRGKYASLPGAGGGVSLEVIDLRESAKADKEDCIFQLENFIVDKPEEIGMVSTMIIG